MIDALNVDNIPATTPTSTLLASYVDHFEYDPVPFVQLQQRFPHHRCVSIAAHGGDAQICDVESGAMTAAEVPAWLTRQRARGVTPMCYATVDNWVAVVVACGRAGVIQPLWWAANWSGGQDIPVGAVARQYAANGRWDTSLLLDHIPGFDDPDDLHPSGSGDPEEDDMATALLPVVMVDNTGGGANVLLRWPDGSYEIVRSGNTAHAFIAAGSPAVTMDHADIMTRTAKARL